MQLRFTPQKQLYRQFEAAARLIAIVDDKKRYPFEFVCFKITGYRPKTSAAQSLIEGSSLARDLKVFLTSLGAKLARPLREQAEKVYTVEELAEELNVSTKTIGRWRAHGLLARKFIFEDGRKRLGFLQSDLDKFRLTAGQAISRAASFRHIGDRERQNIINSARRMASTTGLSRHQVISQIAARTKRAHETIRYTLLACEDTAGNQPIFQKPHDILDTAMAAEIYNLYRQSCGVPELMRRFNRSKSSIYRIINLRRARALTARKIDFISSDEFLEEGSAQRILAATPALTKRHRSELPLKRQQELDLFRKYNCLKYLAYIERTGLHGSEVSGRVLARIEGYLAEADLIKQFLVESNLGLVAGIAGRHATASAGKADLVGEGTLAMMNALEKFDYMKGYRFATYAAWAVAKHYARIVPAESPVTAGDWLATIQKNLRTSPSNVQDIEMARRNLVQVAAENLNEREQYIILNHFGLTGSPIRKKTMTLKQIGENLNLSKERVRQIELTALQKLRNTLSIEQFELLKR